MRWTKTENGYVGVSDRTETVYDVVRAGKQFRALIDGQDVKGSLAHLKNVIQGHDEREAEQLSRHSTQRVAPSGLAGLFGDLEEGEQSLPPQVPSPKGLKLGRPAPRNGRGTSAPSAAVRPTVRTSAPTTAPAASTGSEEGEGRSPFASGSPRPLSPASAGAPPAGSLADKLRRNVADGNSRPVQAPHLEVTALAGTGKTTSAVEGLAFIKGVEPRIKPSPEQEAIWEQMALGKSDQVRVCAFNSSITAEVRGRLAERGLDKKGCEAKGIHALGFGAVNKAFGYQEPTNFAMLDKISSCLGGDYSDLKMQPQMLGIIRATEELVSLCKQNLLDPTRENLDRLTSHYDVEIEQGRDQVFGLVPEVLEKSKSPTGKIAFDDQIWLPLVLGLPIYKTDVVIGDEAQDFNRMQQELVYRAGYRVIYIGDRHQAIYGFAGADAESMDRMGKTLAATPRGLRVLPLTETRRCGHAIVEEARRIVPEYRAHPSNCPGSVLQARYPVQKTSGQLTGGVRETRELKWEESYCAMVKPGDMILCRVNAPLVSQCFRFLRAGIKANILGRKIGEGLVALIRKAKAETTPDLVSWLGDWLSKEEALENAKKFPSEAKIIALQDKHDCLVAFTEGCQTVADVENKIGSVFADKRCPKCGKAYRTEDKVCSVPSCRSAELELPSGVRLSSIHRSKGLEADRVFLLQPEGATVPHPMAKKQWELEQEWNLKYVALTRARRELIYVS